MQMGWACFVVLSVGRGPRAADELVCLLVSPENLLPRVETVSLQPRLMKLLDVSLRLVNSF